MSNNIINPNTFSVDLEATQLPKDFNVIRKLGEPFRLPDLNDIISGFASVDIFQIGYIVNGKRTHVDVTNTDFVSPEFTGEPLANAEEYIDANGVKRTYRRRSARTATRSGYDKLFKSTANRMTKSLTEEYRRNILPHYLNKSQSTQFILDNGGAISSMPFNMFKTPYEEVRAAAQRAGFDYMQVSQQHFFGKGSGSLYEAVDNLLASTEQGKTAVIRAWNPIYDVSAIIATLHRSGHKDLVDRFMNQYKNGLLKITPIEEDWHKIMWKLLRENKDISGEIKIGMHPIAAATTGRPGRSVLNFNEFKYSTYTWSQDSIARYFKGHTALSEMSHFASTDILQSENFSKILEDIKNKAVALSGATDFNELMAMEDTGDAFTDAFNRMIQKDMAESGHGNVRSLLTQMAEEAHRKDNFFRSNFPSWFASGVSKRSRASFKKYPGVITAAIGLLGATYIGSGDIGISLGDGGIDPETGAPIGGNIASNINSTTNAGGNLFRAIGTGMIMPTALLAGIGYGAAQRNPMVGNVAKPTNATEAFLQLAKTVRYGVKTAEGHISLARVFGIGSMTDYLFGSRRYVVDELGRGINGKPARFHTFNIIQRDPESKIVKVLSQEDPGHGTFLTELMEKLKESNKSQHDKLKAMLEPSIDSMRPGTIPDQRQVRIASTNTGKTFVQWHDYRIDEFGKRQKITSGLPMIIDKSVIFSKMRDVVPQAARHHIRHSDKNRVIVTSAWDRTYESMLKHGDFKKATFDEYFSELTRPGFISRVPEGEKIWRGAEKLRWMLDLAPKGVGQSKNRLVPNATTALANTSTTVMVKDFNHYASIAPRWVFGHMDKFLETPFEFLLLDTTKMEEFANRLKGSQNPLSNLAGKFVSGIQRPHLGIGYAQHGASASKYLLNLGIKRILPAFLAINAFQFADHALGAITMSDTGRGPLTELPIKAFESASLLYTKLSDITGLTDYAKWQANVAPGSTGIGIFAPAATLTATYFLGELAYKKGPDFLGGSVDKAANLAMKHPFMKAAMRPEAYRGAIDRGPVERFMSFAIKNPKKAIFALSMLPAIPFVPGFLGSDTNYKEKKAMYDGEKEVAIRKYRGWLFSSSPFEGGKVRSWRRHALNLMESDFENRGVVYPSFWQRFAHNVSLGLYKPNILEEYHKESQPVYKSAPWGANIPLLGPIIAGTVGQVIGQKTYHDPSGSGVSMSDGVNNGAISQGLVGGGGTVNYMMELQDPSSTLSMASRFTDTLADLAGFRGFTLQTMYGKSSGKSLPDQYVPYAQDASQMYSPAEQMWQYSLGDITVVGGEFLRRILQNSEKKWQVNDIPNELAGVSWIPSGGDRDLTKGTTFDKVDMGWLYGARKGWEFLYPGEATGDLESYSAPIRTEILKHIAPYSRQFNLAAQNTLELALTGKLDPKREQRFYETLEQVSQVKEQLYATAAEYSYALETEDQDGIVQELDETSGSFMVGGEQYRLAGVSTNEADIRARLLQKQEFETAQELDKEVQRIKRKTSELMRKHLSPGQRINMKLATADMISTATTTGKEAIVDDLSEQMWDAGAPFANTGNLATHNMAQERGGFTSRIMASYWDALTSTNSYWNKKLISQRDYLDNYLANQVFNREVKLWTRPIDHLLKPFIASTMHNWFGIDTIPSFTKERRGLKQHWDVIKYIKYRTMASRAKESGDMESAAFFEAQWRGTMIGTDPTNSTNKDELAALSGDERRYFRFFANEPDPSKRGEIYKYLPEQSKRIYSSIWMGKIAANSNDPELQKQWKNLQESEGWTLSEEEEQEYLSETGGTVNKADWARARFIQYYAEQNNLPGPDWIGWDPNVNIENVQMLSLMEEGENVQDYGFFDSKIRQAVYDDAAYKAALDVESSSETSGQLIDRAIPYLMDDNINSIYMSPTNSNNTVSEVNIETNGYDKILRRMNDIGSSLLPDDFL